MVIGIILLLFLFNPGNGKIRCYDCPQLANNFTYVVTATQIPERLENCTIKSIGDTCVIEVKWSDNPSLTQIGLVAEEGDRRVIEDEHTLNTYVSLENKDEALTWTRSISYTCSSDECNQLGELRRVLNALTLSDQLRDLTALLTIDPSFVGSWCDFFYANTTVLECALNIPRNSCGLCSYQSFKIDGALEICASCLPFSIGETFIAHEVEFDLKNRTKKDHWILDCQSKSCSTLENGELIRRKTVSEFSFQTFFNRSHHLSTSNLVLLAVVFLFIHYLA